MAEGTKWSLKSFFHYSMGSDIYKFTQKLIQFDKTMSSGRKFFIDLIDPEKTANVHIKG